MTTNIYDQHRAAFSNVSAYVVLKDGKRVASVAFKFPRDGAGRLYCYLHIFGAPMARGYAGGYGYDKRSAACEAAAAKHSRDAYPEDLANIDAIKAALAGDSGYEWDRRLRDAGFDVVQAV
jgi:hypothetical protein